MRTKPLLLLAAFVLLLAGGVAAQEPSLDEQPLMQMLARVPQVVPASSLLFSDWVAITQAYPEAQLPPDWDTFAALDKDNLTDESRPLEIWWRIFLRYSSSTMGRFLSVAETLPESLGLDAFQIERELYLGMVPEDSLILTGSWEREAISTALATRNYGLVEEVAAAQLWCEDDCLTGSFMNVDGRDPANPFGGQLGQNWPMVVSDGLLIGNRSEPIIRDYMGAADGSLPTLAEDPLWRSAVTAALQDGILLQAAIYSGNDLATLGDPLAGLNQPTLSAAQLQQILQTRLEGYITLPPFQLLMIADTISQGEQVTKVVLVYSTETAAQTAADALPDRISRYESLVRQESFSELLTGRNINLPTAEVQGIEGLYATVLHFTAPQPDIETLLAFQPGDDLPEGYAEPGIAFNLLNSTILRGDIGWISTAPREALEAIANS
jgi:hypothetical protein